MPPLPLPDKKAMASYSDVNGDGIMDLVVQIEDTDGAVIGAGATEVVISGYLYDGPMFISYGDINLVPPTS